MLIKDALDFRQEVAELEIGIASKLIEARLFQLYALQINAGHH
jgi:hypothetical protein